MFFDDDDCEDPYGPTHSNQLCSYCVCTIDEFRRPPESISEVDFTTVPSCEEPRIRCWECWDIEPILYAGYIHCTFHGGWPFLQRQIQYTKKYPDFEAYWVETSERAYSLNAIACELFEDLIDTTKLFAVKSGFLKKRRKDFPFQSWVFPSGLQPMCIAACCFRFSDCWLICDELR